MVSAGMTVLRQSCRNTNITSTTRPIASSSVMSTSLIDSDTTMVLSKASSCCMPGGNRCDNRSNSAVVA